MAEAWPQGLYPRSMTWGCRQNNRAFTSTLSNAQQIVGYPGAYWVCALQFDVLTPEKERLLSGLAGRLQGMFGTVNVPAFGRQRDDDIGAPVVQLMTTQASIIGLSGFTVAGRVFSQGDYITIGGQLYEVVADAVAVNGRVDVRVNKPVRSSFAQGTPVEYRRPFCEMRLTTDLFSLNVDVIRVGGSIDLREAF